MEYRPLALEHGTSRAGRWLRVHRVKLALGLAVLEGLLVALDVIPGWVALVGAAAIIAFYLFVGRSTRSDTLRQTSWTLALSQVLVALIPVLVFVIGTLAVIAVAVLAIAALVALLADRR